MRVPLAMVVERFGPIGGQVLAVAVGSLTVVEGHPFGGPQRQFGGTGIELKRPGFPGGSGYWIPIKGWSVRYAS